VEGSLEADSLEVDSLEVDIAALEAGIAGVGIVTFSRFLFLIVVIMFLSFEIFWFSS